MNKISIHVRQRFFRLLTVLYFLLLSNIIYSQYYSCRSTNPCPQVQDLGNYTLSGQKWNKTVLKYYFINGTDDISGDGEKTAFYSAFDIWSAFIPIRFEEVYTSGEADIKIRFATTTEWESADVSLSAWAISYYPEQDCHGNIVLNDGYWNFNITPGNNSDLYYIALHEVGHVLGLCHSDNSSTVMYHDPSPKRTLHSYDIQGIQLVYPSISVTAQNNFDGGKIYVNNFSTEKTAPYNITIESGGEVEISLGAIEQNDGTYDRIWNDNEAPLNLSAWVKETSLGVRSDRSFSQNHTFEAKQDDNNSTYEAGLRKVCEIDFENQFAESSMPGEMKVNGTTYSASVTHNVVEQNSITFEAAYYYNDNNGFEYTFDQWSDGNNNMSRTVSATQHKTYTAQYSTHAAFNENEYRNLRFDSNWEGYLRLTWDDHPSTDVTKYRVYRQVVGINGQHAVGPVELIRTVNRGTTQIIDTKYLYDAPGEEHRIFYDVQAYYAPEGTYSLGDWELVTATLNPGLQKLSSENEELITKYDIGNYPNPYNPQTTIRFQLPQEGFVTIKVYNSIGEEIKTLLNEKKEYGMYELKFDGNDLPSGMYIYTIKVNDYYASKKMLLVK